jgi:GTP-binding protein
VNRPKIQSNSQKLRFLTSAVDLHGCPSDKVPEVAIVGRSNAGKSSLINGIAGSRIAQVSGTPGKTRLLNFYQFPRYRLVDMPGYGFAARSGSEQRDWTKMVESFLGKRDNLIGLLIVMDIRRDWSEDEDNLIDWLRPRMLPAAVVLTKADKLSKSAMLERVRAIKKQSGLESVIATSTLKKLGFNEIEGFIYETWVKPVDSPAKEDQ